MDSLREFKQLIRQAVREQMRAVETWHEDLPGEMDPEQVQGLRGRILQQHFVNFTLWHVEDEARRKDVGPEVIAECKQKIDGLNQKRNDLIEQMDEEIVRLLQDILPGDALEKYNTETMGMALDRLSILSLKMFHMQEQTCRDDVDQEHVLNCSRKLSVLREQHRDLTEAVLDLADEYGKGLKQPKIYHQFKMYNDPNLNPQLYGHKQTKKSSE